MNIKELIEDIFKLLPNNIKNNMINKIVEELFINELDSNMDYEIILNEDIYNRLSINDPSINSFPNNEKNFLIELQFIGNKNITYTIANFNIKSNIELRVTTEDNGIFTEKSVSLQINNSTNNSELITQVVEKDNNDYYYNYEYDIHRYDSNYKKNTENIEEDIDENFKEIFHVPIENSRVYRKNFKMYSKYLNREKVKYEMEEVDKQYMEDYYVFDGPYDNLEHLKETLREHLEIDENIEDENLDIYYDRIDNIIENLSNVIGKNEFIMTINLYENIYRYIISLSHNVLFTNGIIIQKENKQNIMTNIHIENDKLISIPKILSNDELYEIYENTEIDDYDDDLQDFFGFNKGNNRYK